MQLSALFLALAAIAGAQAAPVITPLGNGGVFAVDCGRTARKNLDPLVKPKQPGASHIHDFFGPKVVSDNATIGTLASQPTSCSFDADRSAYWVPALYSKGVLQEGDAIQAYYFLDKGSRAPPKGLAMLAGDPKLNRTQPGKGAGWACGPESNYGQTFPPNCSPDGWLLVQVDFPSCWNGKDLDSADHRSHMAHPPLFGSLPHNPSTSGSAGGMHADWVSGWTTAAFNQLITKCGNKDCGHIANGMKF